MVGRLGELESRVAQLVPPFPAGVPAEVCPFPPTPTKIPIASPGVTEMICSEYPPPPPPPAPLEPLPPPPP